MKIKVCPYPSCKSADIYYWADFGKWSCNKCRSTFDQPKIESITNRVKSQCIFLSYGHDENQFVVERIKSDLEQRGHEVWIDNEKIKGGDNWRSKITDGILNCDQFLAMLSTHSVRKPGVCLDEIGIAINSKHGLIHTVLVEPGIENNVPNIINHMQYVDMQDWREYDDKKYAEQFKNITAAIESKKSLDFSVDMEKIKEIYKKSGTLLKETLNLKYLEKPFYGRDHTLKAIEEWAHQTNGNRMLWFKGAPGTGKTALVTRLTHQHLSPIIAYHYCNYKEDNSNTPLALVQNLSFQIASRLPQYRSILVKILMEYESLNGLTPTELFKELLSIPLHRCIDGGHGTLILIVDALDEATHRDENPIAQLISEHIEELPNWVKLMVTSRPDVEVVKYLNALNNSESLELETNSDESRKDIATYVKIELRDQLKIFNDKDLIIDKIQKKSEGNFLYIELLTSEIKNGSMSLNNVDQFPQSLT